ncbi:MAG: hypothetical protein ABI288_00740 [Ginsengibacter sp.]
MILSVLRLTFVSFALICLSFSLVNAQYFYKDIMSTSKLNSEFAILKKGNIRSVKITSYDENDKPSEGFFCEKKINKNFSQTEMMSQSNITGQSLLITDYNAKGQIINTVTTTPNTTNTVNYQYNDHGNLSLITTKTVGNGDSDGIEETHEYFYEDDKPVKMLRKKNKVLVSTITFLSDEKGNVIEEHALKNSSDIKYYYYYDDSDRLTDVVHYNPVAKRLLPDYMFEYNKNNEPKQMISVDESGRNYFIWKYAYDDKTLPEIQKCYSKEKRLLGTIQYDYK